MKMNRRVFGAGTLFLWLAAFCLGAVGEASATQYCQISLTGCPQDYDGKELVVPPEVIAISTHIRACEYMDSTTSQVTTGGTPAIMFIIDNSGSMDNEDPSGNRFKITRALIDSVFKEYPLAEVGMVIFTQYLQLNAAPVSGPTNERGDPRVVKFNGSTADPTSPRNAVQGFLPLMPLNRNITADGYYDATTAGDAGATVRGLYRSLFNVPPNANQAATIRPTNLIGGSTGQGRYTDISLAFEAAVQAFAETSIPKENQYIIFLSDGAPNLNTSNTTQQRVQRANSYITEVNGKGTTPTTYTVFLKTTSGCNATCASDTTNLRRMTNNIRDNEYSMSNKSSQIWVLKSEYDALLALMMEYIITPMLARASGEAKKIVISSGSSKDSSGVEDGNFKFKRQLPIDTSEVTEVKMGMYFDVKIDSSWVGPGGVMKDTSWIHKDSLFNYTFTIKRSREAEEDWMDQGLLQECSGNPVMTLTHNGQTVTTLATSADSTQVKDVRRDMERLTVTFDNTGGLFDYPDKIVVQVTNTSPFMRDVVNCTLSRVGTSDVWVGGFERVEATEAIKDNILQHGSPDSIIVIFQDPDLPLHNMRIAAPYLSSSMAFYDKPGDPKAPGVTQFPDTMTVAAGASLDIYAKIFDSDGNWNTAMTNDAAKIKWTVSEPSIAKLTFDGSHATFTSETAGRVYLVTAIYDEGGPLEITRQMRITVVPGAPHYLEVLFDYDSTKIVQKADTNSLKRNKEYTFERDVEKTTFYVLERDRFGNLIGSGLAEGSEWRPHNGGSAGGKALLTTEEGNNGGSALITRHGDSFGDDWFIIVEKGGIADTVQIKVIGESAVAIGPNPFVPGRDSPADMLRALEQESGSKVSDAYWDIIEKSGSGSGSGGGDKTGVLIAASAPRSIKTKAGPGGARTPMATVVIYDAVGNIVFKNKPGDLVLASDGNSFGFIWDGKNTSGRTVGAGTYLVRMVGTQTDGHKFSIQRKIGVTVEGKVKAGGDATARARSRR